MVRDSSIWKSKEGFEVVKTKDMSVRVGIVRESVIDPNNDDIGYIVEVFNCNNQIPVYCRKLEKFGGAYNYEEFTLRGYNYGHSIYSAGLYDLRAGDVVIVAFVLGDSREGAILGCLKHPGRKRVIEDPTNIQYVSEFNGVNTSINTDGELTVTFKGIPTNVDDLLKPPTGQDVPVPVYDPIVGTSNYKFDKNGGWTVTDNAQIGPQTIYINKPSGQIVVTSGEVSIVIDKKAQSITVQTKDTTINSTNSISETTTNYTINASSTYTMRSPKIAIGHSNTELLDQITKLVDAIGTLTAVSPMGPCSALITAPQWQSVNQVKEAINEIKGSL